MSLFFFGGELILIKIVVDCLNLVQRFGWLNLVNNFTVLQSGLLPKHILEQTV